MTVSPHPVDLLIRELIATRRAATAEEIAAIVGQMAAAPFDRRIVPVPSDLRGTVYDGRTLGARDTALTAHLVKRVVVERQWARGTTAAGYIADLRRAISAPQSRLGVYERRGDPIAVALAPTAAILAPSQHGLGTLPLVLVVYSADRGIILSGYQVSSLSQTGVPQEVRWLNRP